MIENSKRIVFKFGTNILRNEDGEISLSHLYSFIEDMQSFKHVQLDEDEMSILNSRYDELCSLFDIFKLTNGVYNCTLQFY